MYVYTAAPYCISLYREVQLLEVVKGVGTLLVVVVCLAVTHVEVK